MSGRKTIPGMGSFYRSQHELVFVFRNGKGQQMNNVELGKVRAQPLQTSGITPLMNSARTSEEGNLLLQHPTVKPVELVQDAILDASARGDLVLDSFLGSGTTLIAAERVGRICFGMELDPLYVDLIIRRWQRQSGDIATHSETGKSFHEMSAEKAGVNWQRTKSGMESHQQKAGL